MRNETYLSPFSGYIRPAANVFGSVPLDARSNPINETVSCLSRAIDGLSIAPAEKESFSQVLTHFSSDPSDKTGLEVVQRLLDMYIALASLAPGTSVQLRRGIVGLIDFAKIASAEMMTSALLRVGESVFEGHS